MNIRDIFLAHPEAAGESYFGHMRFAFGFAGRLFGAAAAAFMHGLVPTLFETSASGTVLELSDELKARRAVLQQGKAMQATRR